MTENTEKMVAEDKNLTEQAAANTAATIPAEDGIETLRKRLESEQNARAAAEQRAVDAETRAHRASTEMADTNLTLLTEAVKNAKRDGDVLKANYAAAMAASDFNTAADLQMQMAQLGARLVTLENGKEQLEKQPKTPPPPRYADPVEVLASQLSPRSAQWVRSHPEYARDPRLTRQMVAAHNLLETQGVAPDTDDYFNRIESTLGINQTTDDPMADAAAVIQRRQAPPAAPVGRGNSPGKSNVVRLTAEEREIASMMGMSDSDYAKNKQELRASGRL